MIDEFDHLLTEIDFLNSELTLQSYPLDKQTQHILDLEFTFESNRLEGSTLTLGETDMAIKLGLMMPGKTMSEYLAAINHYQAVQFIHQQVDEQALLSEVLIKQIHSILLRGIDQKHSGIYRTEPLFYAGAHNLPEPQQLPALIAETLHWLRLEGPFLHPVIFAAETHQRLMALQPFSAANGTYARLLMNMILLEAGYPLANIPGNSANSLDYYHALEQANEHGQKQAWLWLIAKQVKTDIEAFLERLQVGDLMAGSVKITP